MLVTFKAIKNLFVKSIINTLPIDYRSFINKANIVADYFLNNANEIKRAATYRECSKNKFSKNVGRKLGRTRPRWQDGAKLFLEKCCLI